MPTEKSNIMEHTFEKVQAAINAHGFFPDVENGIFYFEGLCYDTINKKNYNVSLELKADGSLVEIIDDGHGNSTTFKNIKHWLGY